MEPLILQTASEDAGKRLDAWLAEQTELTRSAVAVMVSHLVDEVAADDRG